MHPEVSVVIPSFNHESYIDEAVSSVLACTDVELEVVVVDDGSTDGTRDRLRAWDAEPRVRVELQPNRGAHAALNRGLELARGELIFILDSDDAFDERRMPMLADRLRDNPDAAIAASWIEVIDSAGAQLGVKQAWHTLPPWPARPGPSLSDLNDPRLALLDTNWISTTSNLAFRASLVRRHGLRFAPLRYAHDWDFILSACHHGGVELVDEALVRYRVHGANTIDEGGGAGQGAMRFEIMWVVARHAVRLLRTASGAVADFDELRNRFVRSAPTFGLDDVLDRLLVLRGTDDESPGAYNALIEPDHPFRRAFLGRAWHRSDQSAQATPRDERGP